jgi:DnaJ-domain-containing protein 1
LQTSQWLEADRVSRELLRLNPQNAAARAAQVQLQGRQDLLQLERAKKLMDAGEFERAVGVLIRVPVESELYQQARDLIREAEAKSQIQQNLKNARDSIRVGNWDQARFQIKKVLDQDPNNPEALALLKEIESGEQADLVKFWGIPAVVLVSFAGLGLYLVRRRPRWLQKVVVDEGQAPEGQRPFRVRQEPPEAKSSGPSLDEQRYREALTKTTELLRLALRKDAHREHAVRLMDFQAEIKVIAQKGEAPDADFRRLTTQLLVLQQTLRGMKFRGKARGKETGTRPKSEEQSQQKQSSEQASGPEPAAPSGNYYELLGVSPSAPLEEIKKAYHQKLKEYHPDRHQSSEFSWVREQAEAMTLKLRQAYDVLSDPAARQKYDRTL